MTEAYCPPKTPPLSVSLERDRNNISPHFEPTMGLFFYLAFEFD